MKTPPAVQADGAEEGVKRGLDGADDATHGRSNVIPFPLYRKPRGRCCLCGALLGDGDGFSACLTCNLATDLTARVEWLLAEGSAQSFRGAA